ncbi:hypothetical protein PoB_007502100, partial [Plakobranchus ocellatus]
MHLFLTAVLASTFVSIYATGILNIGLARQGIKMPAGNFRDLRPRKLSRIQVSPKAFKQENKSKQKSDLPHVSKFPNLESLLPLKTSRSYISTRQNVKQTSYSPPVSTSEVILWKLQN